MFEQFRDFAQLRPRGGKRKFFSFFSPSRSSPHFFTGCQNWRRKCLVYPYLELKNQGKLQMLQFFQQLFEKYLVVRINLQFQTRTATFLLNPCKYNLHLQNYHRGNKIFEANSVPSPTHSSRRPYVEARKVRKKNSSLASRGLSNWGPSCYSSILSPSVSQM